MQIHEVTFPVIREGLLDVAKQAAGGFVSGLVGAETGIGAANPAQRAQQAADALAKKGYGPGYQGGSTDWKEKYKTVVSNPAVTSYINNIASSWKTVEPKTPTKEATGDDVRGVTPGAPTPQELLKLQQRISQASKTATPDEKEKYIDQFKKWSDSQLFTKTSTGDEVEMALVRKLPGIEAQLNRFLDNIWTARGTPQQERAIQEYLKVAVSGVQALAQSFRNKRAQAGATRGKPINSTGDADLDKALEKAGYRILK